MSRKNRPNKRPPQKPAQAPVQPPVVMHQTPVTHGDVFATFLNEATQIGNEVTTRRAHDREVAEFIASKGLTAEFDAWRQARQQVKSA